MSSGSNTTDQSYYEYMNPILQRVVVSMNFWMSVLVLLPGMISNCCMSFVFMRKKFWKDTTMGYYYSVQPWISNAYILFGFVTFFSSSIGRDWTLISQTACTVTWCFRTVTVFSIQYFLVQMTVDRALNVLYPRRFLWLSRPRNLAKLTGLIFLVFSIYSVSLNMFRTITFVPVLQNGTRVMVPSSCTFQRAGQLGNNFSFIIIRISGLSLTFILNLAIIKRLLESKQNIRKHRPSGSNNGMSHKELVFIVSLLSSNFIQLILWTPFLVLNTIQVAFTFNPSLASPQQASFINNLVSISRWGNYLFESSLFFINLCTNRIFRAELTSVWFQLRREARTSTLTGS